MNRFSTIITLLVVVAISGCSDKSTNDDENLITNNAVRLLGLQEDVECEYIKYDTIISYYPSYFVTIDTSLVEFAAQASDSTRSQINLWFDSKKTSALKITSNSVVNLGYFRTINDADSLFKFSEPPQIFPLTVQTTDIWDSYSPPISPDGYPWIGSKLYFSYGMENRRSFERSESLLLPLDNFICFVFKNEYRMPGTVTPFRTSYEYYSLDFGLVKMYSTGTFGSSHVFMISREATEATPAR
ncbi:MAG: hypothetical protein ABIK83_14570 [Candidatus Zixiibacteriota bacterium]